MPYLPSEAAKKSRLYNNIVNGDEREYQEQINDLKNKQQVSASVNSNTPLRDEDGVLVSFESATPGISLEEDFEEVRLENKQFFFTGQIDNEFTFYFQPIATDDTTESTTNATNTKEIEFALTLRDYLIQFVNEYFAEENGPDISTDKLHNKLLQFFDENRSKGNNAQGWKEFRLNESRKAAGISGKRFKKVKKDLRDFQYDELIENHLYRTPQGQRIWLRLGFPYIVDQSPGKDS
tara:strand:+ start:1469 stop:2176 length:708 start_codon:yes stop_codon:yes gene_type:complete